ncbi:Eukaryotic translation initiation factor 3 subunit [Vigna angularis]|uniref:Serine-threonine kinase receptor-associated protein n=1 Tax=Phaseolus angularis TaxID=3914 RepID=A0A8T0KH31_PHAAN|nr:Eukaryotic translation initiation factor 3 subunit [Vigna angularis]
MHEINFLPISISGDSARLITGSADQIGKLWSVQTGHQLYSFNFDSPARSVDFSVGDKLAVITERPLNAVAMSPLLDHILQEETGGVKGHFGPINALAFNPDGKRYIHCSSPPFCVAS